MNRVKKSFSIICLIAILVGMFVSCGDDSSPSLKDRIKNIINKKNLEYREDLRSANIILRKEAIEYFTNNPDSAVAEYLLKALADKSPIIRIVAIRAVGSNEIEKAIDSLVQSLSSSDKEVVRASIVALGKIGEEKRTLGELIGFLSNENYQLEAIWALGTIGDKSAIPPLTELLSSGDKYVVYNATMALKKIR